ncbi:Uncharacterized protein OBRU01_01957, partial [Operophtera brumata]
MEWSNEKVLQFIQFYETEKAYRAHLNKIKKSIKSGAGANDVYQTNWFAFSAMNSFLQPIYDCRPTIDTQ